MRYQFTILCLFSVLYAGCQKEVISLSTGVSETFYVDNAGASMRVLVEGNTASKAFIVVVHGGPGSTAYIYNTDYISQYLEDKYAMVYWDQRNAGASQGGDNGDKLKLDQYVEDLKKVIQVIKYRYGKNASVFILGHSFGGLITAGFVTKNDYQSLIKGWICMDGSHNYGLNDTLTRQMLSDVGKQQVTLNNHVDEWNEIIDYCNLHTGSFSLDESDQLYTYGADAETYMDSVNQISIVGMFLQFAFKDDIPLTSVLVNYLYSIDSDLDAELAQTEFSSALHKVTIPTLLLYGKYDFICPIGLADDIYSRISSAHKKIVISPVSGHNLFLQDESLFCTEVADFVARFK